MTVSLNAAQTATGPRAPAAAARPVHVSITGLSLKRPWHAPGFWLHAVAAMAQARRAPGCLSADARTVEGVHHTLSVWTDRAAMLAYLRVGAHARAMRLFPVIATGRTVGFTATQAPDWPQAVAIWRAQSCAV